MRTTITLDDDVFLAAKALAESTGRTLGNVLSDLARAGLKPRPHARRGGLPVFDVPADAKVIPADRAAELLADEGVE
jgi:hypothetical protein